MAGRRKRKEFSVVPFRRAKGFREFRVRNKPGTTQEQPWNNAVSTNFSSVPGHSRSIRGKSAETSSTPGLKTCDIGSGSPKSFKESLSSITLVKIPNRRGYGFYDLGRCDVSECSGNVRRAKRLVRFSKIPDVCVSFLPGLDLFYRRGFVFHRAEKLVFVQAYRR